MTARHLARPDAAHRRAGPDIRAKRGGPLRRARRIGRRLGLGGCTGLLGVALIAVGGMAGAGPAGAAPSGASASAASSVTLTGEGTWDVSAELNGWQNALYGSSGAIDLNYVAQSGQAARADLLGGVVDYAISGVPYTSAELAGKSTSGIIASPVMPSAVGFLLNPPQGGFTIQDANGDYSAPYTGQVREPASNLAAQLLHYTATNEPVDPAGTYDPEPGSTQSPYLEWDNPNIVENWDPSFLSDYNPGAGDHFEPNDTAGVAAASPQQVMQAQPNEDNLYLDEWVAEQDPGFWSKLKTASGNAATFQPSEDPQPTLSVTERPGLDQTLQTLENGTLTGTANTSGFVAPVPPSSLDAALAAQQAAITSCNNANAGQPASSQQTCPTVPAAGLNYEWIAVKNAAGQWETPTPQSIDAAIDATPSPSPTATTGASPLYGSTAPVSGAYPLTYVDYLYAPATGLSVAKTEALATVMRYLVTDGQGQLAGNGDGQLSSTLVAQGLAAANHLVESNCPAAGGKVVLTSKAGPYDPNLPGLRSLGPVDHCEAAPAQAATTTTTTAKHHRTTPTTSRATTTTTATPATTPTTAERASTPPASGSGSGSGSSPTPPTTTASRANAAPTTTTSVPTTSTTRAKVPVYAQDISALPFVVAGGTAAGLDKLGALLVGVAAFLLLRRRPAAWLRRVLRP